MDTRLEHRVDDSWFGWITGGIVAIVGGLTAAVTTLWARSEAKNAHAIESLEERAKQCEQDRRELVVRVAKLEARIEHLEGLTS